MSRYARAAFWLIALGTCLNACHQNKCDLRTKHLDDSTLKQALNRLPVLTTEIVTDSIRMKSPRQFYLSKDTISFGNYYNNSLLLSNTELEGSDAWYLRSMNRAHRKELLGVFEVLKKHGLWSAEYDFQLKRYVFYWAKGANYNDDKFVIFLDDGLDWKALDRSYKVQCNFSPDFLVVTKTR